MSTIGIDYTPAYEQTGGIGRLVRELVTQLLLQDTLNNDYRLFVAGANKPFPNLPGKHVQWKSTRITTNWLARIWHKLHLPLPIQTFTGPVDLYHATDFVLPPVANNTPTILTVHDLSFVHVPDAAFPALRRYLNKVVPRSVARATHVLADSEATRQDIIKLYGTNPNKVTTLLSGVDPQFKPSPVELKHLAEKYHFPERPYIFSIGTVQPRKNYERLIGALKQIRGHGYDVDLVISGGRGWLEGPIYQAIEQQNLKDHVHFIGFADDSDLPALYTMAECVGFVSLYEGFGFPVLESMACGTPVVTSNTSSMPEVAGDSAIIIDPYDVDTIANAIEQILNDTSLRQDLITRGYQQVTQFTWERSANQLAQVYSQFLPHKH